MAEAAEYRTAGGALAMVCRAEKATACDGAPAWHREAMRIAERRVKEYQAETGRLPSAELLRAYQAAMRARVEAFIQDGRKPYQYISLKKWEEGENHGQPIGRDKEREKS